MARLHPTHRLETAGGEVIASHVTLATSLGSRFLGLMGLPRLPASHALCLRPCGSIHNFFMRFAIDAVFVTTDGTIVRVYHALRPWRISGIHPKAGACIELAAGTCASHDLQAGDSLRLVQTLPAGQ